MKNWIITFIFVFFVVSRTLAQNTTTLTGTVTDSDSQVWTSATWTARLNYSGPGLPVYISGGQAPLTWSGQLSSGGVFSGSVGNNAQILPPNSTWTFTICSLTSASCSVLPAVSITGSSYNMGAYASSNVTAPRIQAGTTKYAYNTTEIINATQGTGYVNTVSGSQYLYSGGTYVQFGGGGGSGCNPSGNVNGVLVSNGSGGCATNNYVTSTGNSTNGGTVTVYNGSGTTVNAAIGYDGDAGTFTLYNDGFFGLQLNAFGGTGYFSGAVTANGFVPNNLSTSANPLCYLLSGSPITNVGCNSGSGISGLTANYIPEASSSTTIAKNSPIDDGVTTAGTLTSTEPFNINLASSADVVNTWTNTGSMFYRLQATTKNYAASQYTSLAGVLWTAGIYGGADYYILPPSGVQTLDINPNSPYGIKLDANGLTHLIGGVSPNFSNPETLYSAAGTPLPTCASGILGQQRTVSDATQLGTYSGGGSITTPVTCSYNGSAYSWQTQLSSPSSTTGLKQATANTYAGTCTFSSGVGYTCVAGPFTATYTSTPLCFVNANGSSEAAGYNYTCAAGGSSGAWYATVYTNVLNNTTVNILLVGNPN